MKTLNIIKFQLSKEKLSHAYLITSHFPLDKIIKILKIKTPDLLEIKEESIKIGQIREIIHWLSLKPHSSPLKLVVIWQIENLTLEASNALLKILEEPPSKSLLILQTKNLAKVLPTILSRCQIIKEKEKTPSQFVPDYRSPDIIARQSIKEKFTYVSLITESEKENLKKILNLWEIFYRHQLLEGRDCRDVLKDIFRLRDLLSTNTSVKLLLENLLLKF